MSCDLAIFTERVTVKEHVGAIQACLALGVSDILRIGAENCMDSEIEMFRESGHTGL